MSDKNWLRGYCWDMAVALHERTNLPLAGFFDEEGTCHHAFVWDERLRVGIDVRGAKQLELLSKGCAGAEMRPLDREDLDQMIGRPIAPEEVSEAKRYVTRFQVLNSWYTLMRLHGMSEPEKTASVRRRPSP